MLDVCKPAPFRVRHAASECYKDIMAKDYRGIVNKTKSGLTVFEPHTVFELPDRVNNMFAIVLLLVMEWSMYLHLERHDWFAAAALRKHPRPCNRRKLLTSNPVCERKPQRKASCTRHATTSVHTVVVAMAWARGMRHSITIGSCGSSSRRTHPCL